MTKRSTWGRILNSVEDRLEEIAAQGPDGKVVTIPQSLDALAKDIRETTNAIVNCEAEHEKLCRQMAHQQRRMVDQMRALGIKAEVLPEIAASLEKGAGE